MRALALLALLSPATVAAAEVRMTTTCAPLAAILQVLQEQHGEVPLVSGRGPQAVVLTSNPITGSWTVVRITDGAAGPMGCIVAIGREGVVIHAPAT